MSSRFTKRPCLKNKVKTNKDLWHQIWPWQSRILKSKEIIWETTELAFSITEWTDALKKIRKKELPVESFPQPQVAHTESPCLRKEEKIKSRSKNWNPPSTRPGKIKSSAEQSPQDTSPKPVPVGWAIGTPLNHLLQRTSTLKRYFKAFPGLRKREGGLKWTKSEIKRWGHHKIHKITDEEIGNLKGSKTNNKIESINKSFSSKKSL